MFYYSEFYYIEKRNFYEGLAAVRNIESLCGFINEEGKEVVPCQYKDVLDFHEGLAAVQNKQGLWGYINKEGKEVIRCQYKDACDFHEGLARVQNREGLWGFINTKGEEVILCQYSTARDFHEGLALVGNDGFETGNGFKYKFIDVNGEEKIFCDKYVYIGYFHEGLAVVQNREGLCGFINKEGKEVIPCQYKGASDFHEGLARVQNGEGLCGFINKEGKEVIPCQYKSAFDFKKGLARVLRITDVGYIYINKKGVEIEPQPSMLRISLSYNGVNLSIPSSKLFDLENLEEEIAYALNELNDCETVEEKSKTKVMVKKIKVK